MTPSLDRLPATAEEPHLAMRQLAIIHLTSPRSFKTLRYYYHHYHFMITLLLILLLLLYITSSRGRAQELWQNSSYKAFIYYQNNKTLWKNLKTFLKLLDPTTGDLFLFIYLFIQLFIYSSIYLFCFFFNLFIYLIFNVNKFLLTGFDNKSFKRRL